MSKINTPNDVEGVLKETQLDDEDYDKINKQVLSIIKNPQISHLYMPSIKVFAEFNILSPNGLVLRPDRVVVHSEKFASLLDYKTGKKSSSHKKQMKDYEDVLCSMGFNKIDKYLVYFKDLNIVKL